MPLTVVKWVLVLVVLADLFLIFVNSSLVWCADKTYTWTFWLSIVGNFNVLVVQVISISLSDKVAEINQHLGA